MAKRELTRADLKFQEDFGNKLRELRARVGWTQIDLAGYSKVSEGEISKIERGVYGPKFHTIRMLSAALGVPPINLFDFEIHYKLNTNFGPKKIKGPKTTALVSKLLRDGFFQDDKTVSEVIGKCENELGIVLSSDDTSGVLLRLVKAKRLTTALTQNGKRTYRAR